MGKFTEGFKQHARATRRVKLRRRYVNSFPWYEGEDEIMVTDVMNPGPKKVVKILDTSKGYTVGLLFELAGRIIITEIECPQCGDAAKLNIHWPAFRCEKDHKMWEQCKYGRR